LSWPPPIPASALLSEGEPELGRYQQGIYLILELHPGPR